jgi:hypothetical protein
MTYSHTQKGTLVLVVCLVVGLFGVALSLGSGSVAPGVVTLVIVITAAALFSSLTVEVNDNELSWHFGPGLWTYRLPLDDIRDVAVVRNHWWNGWGIRMAPGFRLYNVSGLDAVELRVGPNDVRRIGTDDPHGLANALRAGRGA